MVDEINGEYLGGERKRRKEGEEIITLCSKVYLFCAVIRIHFVLCNFFYFLFF